MKRVAQKAAHASKPLTTNYKMERNLLRSSKITTDRFKELESSENAEALKIVDYQIAPIYAEPLPYSL
jgi:hypothetical protein